MPSELELCNEALALFNQEPIASLSEDSRAARQCNIVLNSTRRQQLVLHPWFFARKQAKLPGSSSPNENYTYVFTQPADCLQVIHRDQDNPFIQEFDIIGTQLYANTTPLYLTYTYDLSDYNKMPPWFYDLLTYALAIPLISALTSNYELQNNLRGIHAQKLRNCRWLDTEQGPRHSLTFSEDFSGASWRPDFISVRWR